MAADLGAAFAAALVDEWARAGVADAVVAPGSRSAPLTLALARDGRLRVHVVIDERSAAFFALGLARGSRRPVVVCCTSGTAGAHFHPAVIEADLSGIPLLVCTANRPPELLDTGAGQTIDQHHL
jgi:2-succinyl-5-enolpyruvyl-6-hydroxy-3-cyclohexene-1-carboxylate synthase